MVSRCPLCSLNRLSVTIYRSEFFIKVKERTFSALRPSRRVDLSKVLLFEDVIIHYCQIKDEPLHLF